MSEREPLPRLLTHHGDGEPLVEFLIGGPHPADGRRFAIRQIDVRGVAELPGGQTNIFTGGLTIASSHPYADWRDLLFPHPVYGDEH